MWLKRKSRNLKFQLKDCTCSIHVFMFVTFCLKEYKTLSGDNWILMCQYLYIYQITTVHMFGLE